MPKHKASSVLGSRNLKLVNITPLTETQKTFFSNYDSGKSQFLIGYPGVGKSFLSLYKAFQDLEQNKQHRQIIIVRSAVPTRDVGFLPGSLDEKAAIYELPYRKICSDLFGRDDAYEILVKHNIVKFVTTSFIRGITLDDSIVIVDEFQSCNGHELSSIITRVGINSKILFCGDFAQTDLVKISEKQGAVKFYKIIEQMPEYFDINTFTSNDIVRSDLVKSFILKQIELYPESI